MLLSGLCFAVDMWIVAAQGGTEPGANDRADSRRIASLRSLRLGCYHVGMNQTNDPQRFATTHWSLVVAAKLDAASQTQAKKALAELCRAYWYPLYAFVRNRGYSPADAEDLTQGFFARLIETRGFASAEPDLGRFRSYLLGALKHFLAHEWEKKKTKKRGGDLAFLELDSLQPEARYEVEPAYTDDLDAEFNRQWAQESIARAIEEMRSRFAAKNKGEFFETLKGSLTGEDLPRSEVAEKLGMTEDAIKVAIHRLRKEFRELLRDEIAETVADSSEIDDEMRQLVNALRKKQGEIL